jgi:deferrochelatase/peroxidase EfeB
VRLANQDANDIFLLRRGYSFTDGIDRRTGQLDAGLFFLAFQRDPRHQFVPLQDSLARHDALNEYIQHVGSALFAIPPGVDSGTYLGQTLLDGA